MQAMELELHMTFPDSRSGTLTKLSLAAICAASLFGGAARAVPTEVYNLDAGLVSSTVGKVTISPISLNEVTVSAVLANSSNLFINSGGPHTPFAFNLSSA